MKKLFGTEEGLEFFLCSLIVKEQDFQEYGSHLYFHFSLKKETTPS